MWINKNKGFNLIEVVVVIALIGALLGIAVVSLGASKRKTRDETRKADLAQIGRFFTLGCYLPQNGGGEYDLSQIVDEMIAKKPDYAKYINKSVKDPSAGMEDKSLYKYIVTVDGKHCVLYANMENKSENITLPEINKPTLGGRSGVFEGTANGWNGTKKYYQISK